MVMRFLVALVAASAITVQASPIYFATTNYDTNALALADGPASFSSQSGTSAPISSQAVAGINDFASSGALAAFGLFTANSEADGFTGSPSALGQSHFVGTFLGYGALNLVMTFSSLNFGGTGDLFVLLTNSISGQLVNTDISTSGTDVFNLFLPFGGVTTLDVTVLSQSATGPGSSASNFAQATISSTSSLVPLPSTPFLLIAGVAAMFIARRRSM